MNYYDENGSDLFLLQDWLTALYPTALKMSASAARLFVPSAASLIQLKGETAS